MLSVLFPGQGSQSIGMAKDLAEQYPVVRDTLTEASEVLGFDLISLINDGPEADLNRTDLTQPAILAVSVAAWRLLQSTTDVKADYMAGHSLGEYSALVCSGVLSFSDALTVVNKRGQFMIEAVPVGVGGMAAIIGLEDDKIIQACEAAAQEEVVSPVNYNSPGQVVIAGHQTAVERACEACLEAGAKRAIPLVVSGPFHSSLMQPAAGKLAEVLDNVKFNNPEVPVVNNVDVSINSSPSDIKDSLIRQLYNPVRWAETVQWFEGNGVTEYIECGPGKVLAGLNKRINRRAPVHLTTDVASYDKLLEKINA